MENLLNRTSYRKPAAPRRHRKSPEARKPRRKHKPPPLSPKPPGWTLELDLLDEALTCFCPPVPAIRFNNEE